jgi:hypothetical protein
VAEQLRGQVTSCVICTVHNETMSASFLVQPQNQGQRVSQFGPQNQQLQFSNLTHKIITTISLFGPQNKDERFVGLRHKTDERMKTV